MINKILLLFILTIISVIPVSATLLDGLVTYHSLDNSDAIGTDYTDKQGLNDMTNSSLTCSATGKLGEACFQSVTQTNYAFLSSSTNLPTGDSDVAINFWFKYTGTHSGTPCYQMGYGSAVFGQSIEFTMETGANAEVGWFGASAVGSAITTNTWKMITLMYNSTTNNVSIWQNGVLDTSAIQVLNLGVAEEFELGRRATQNNYGCSRATIDSYFDELAIYNRTLAPEELTELYNSGSGLTFDNFNPLLSVDWDGQTPLNNEVRADDPLVFNYTLANVDTTATCNLFSNKTGSFSSNEDSEASMTDGQHQLSYTPTVNETKDLTFKINCTDSIGDATTSIKTIEIDTLNVVITYLDPLSDSSTTYDQIDLSAIISIRYSNHNLDYVNYTVTYPNGSIAQTNVSTVFVDPLNYEFNDVVSFTESDYGVWTVTAYGNDTQGLEQTRVTTFTVLHNVLEIDWDAQTPLNSASLTDQTVVNYNFDLTVGNVTANCILYENGISVVSNDFTTSGIKYLSQSYDPVSTQTNNYNVNCTALLGVLEADTTQKSITITNNIINIKRLGLLTLVPVFVMIGILTIILRKFNINK